MLKRTLLATLFCLSLQAAGHCALPSAPLFKPVRNNRRGTTDTALTTDGVYQLILFYGKRAGITVALFVIAFSFVGQSFNQYWGSMTAPLMCLGVARSLGTLKGLWKAARHVPRACSSAA